VLSYYCLFALVLSFVQYLLAEHHHVTCFAALQHLSKCSELLILKLGLCSSISDKGLALISSNCAKLVELDLYR
jgi:hypothetical protein